MAGKIVPGQRTWSMSRDREGQREYKIKFLVQCLAADGPAVALTTPGLPASGDFWVFDNDIDLWATCKLDAQVKSISKENTPNRYFEVEFTFSTKGDEKRCKDQQIDNPLLQPQQVSGGFKNYSEEATYDRFGRPVLNSAFEIIRGQQVEFDKNRPTVKVQQNVSDLQLPLLATMQDTVNDSFLWGMPPRTVKLGNVTWERKFYGLCLVYYSRTLEFEIRYDTFDKFPLDEGTKVLSGHWATPNDIKNGKKGWVLDPFKNYDVDNPFRPNPDPDNPSHFIRFPDPTSGNPTKVILDGGGLPVGVQVGSGAEAECTLAIGGNIAGGGVVDDVAVLAPGSGYTGSPEVIFTGGGGDGAAGFAVVFDGGISEVVITSGGEGYTSPPVVTFNTIGGPGAVRIEKYPESNFLLLGIPTQF